MGPPPPAHTQKGPFRWSTEPAIVTLSGKGRSSEAASILELPSLPWGPPVGSGDEFSASYLPQSKRRGTQGPGANERYKTQDNSRWNSWDQLGSNSAEGGASLHGAREPSQSTLINLPTVCQGLALQGRRETRQGSGSGRGATDIRMSWVLLPIPVPGGSPWGRLLKVWVQGSHSSGPFLEF